ncbi:hypothetical protein TNCV_1022151 [Trichonephila clavipes]|nr:hypothetical protein TNCV_1022151 [Trichonephila clavipes]
MGTIRAGPEYPTHFVLCVEQNVLDTVRRTPSPMLGIRVTHSSSSLCLLPSNDLYSHKLRCKFDNIRQPSASLGGYLSRYNLFVDCAFPSANPSISSNKARAMKVARLNETFPQAELRRLEQMEREEAHKASEIPEKFQARRLPQATYED